ncbi:MAG: c-type cytochrome [Candidatus Methylumidiphilus sp.]
MRQTAPLMLCALILSASAAQAAATPAADRPDAKQLAHACAGCHGTYGHSEAPTPRLARMPTEEFLAAMRDFKSRQRTSSVMNRIASAYTDEDFVSMAQFFAKQ